MANKATAKKTKPKATKKANVEELHTTTEETSNPEQTVPEGQMDLTKIAASDFVNAFEGHVEQLTNTLWEAILKANKEGVFVNRNVAASAFAEVSLRICVAQAKSIEGGVERFMQVLDL